MANNKIYHERYKCIGCSACASIAPDFWEMVEIEDEYKSHLPGSKIGKDAEGVVEEKDIKDNDTAINKEAAESCPVNCIHIITDGKIINDNSEMDAEQAKKISNGEGVK